MTPQDHLDNAEVFLRAAEQRLRAFRRTKLSRKEQADIRGWLATAVEQLDIAEGDMACTE
jgi:hypothetical protein